MGRLADALEVATTVTRVAYEQDIKYPAAALAYYAFVSFIPLLLLVFAVIGEQLAVQIAMTTPRFLTHEAQQLVYDAMTVATGRTGAGLFALVVLAWSGTNVVVSFQAVIERIENTAKRSLSDQFRDAVIILGSFGLAIVSIIFTSTLFALLPAAPLVGFAGFLVLIGALTVAFLPLYYIPSRLATSPSAALPGALTAAFGWTVIHTAIQFYTANAAKYAIYGVLSGVIIILTSLYIAAGVLMVGIIVNATLTDELDTHRSSHYQ